jgi:hypothetical protein
MLCTPQRFAGKGHAPGVQVHMIDTQQDLLAGQHRPWAIHSHDRQHGQGEGAEGGKAGLLVVRAQEPNG